MAAPASHALREMPIEHDPNPKRIAHEVGKVSKPAVAGDIYRRGR